MYKKWEESLPVEAVPGAFRRTLAVGDQTLLVEWRISKDAGLPLHQHRYEQIGYIVRGEVELTIGEETQLLHPGDGYCVPSGVWHSAIASQECSIVDVFHPVREEYR